MILSALGVNKKDSTSQTICTSQFPRVRPMAETTSAETCRLSAVLKWDMDVSKNRGTQKWMVYNGKPY